MHVHHSFRALCAAVLALALLLTAVPATRVAANTTATITSTSKGVTWNFGRWWDDTNKTYNWTGIESDLNDMQRGNITWVKLTFNRSSAFSVYDRLLPLLQARGISALGHVLSPKTTYFGGGSTYQTDYKTWLANTVARYKGDIHYWEIHNEPNLRFFWQIDENTSDAVAYANSVKDYVALLQASYQAIKGADSTAKVVHGGLASWKSERFVDELIKQGAGQYFDIMGYHPYADWSKVSPDGVIDQVTKYHNRVAGSSLANKPLWITEIGFNTVARDHSAVADEGVKAAYLVEMMEKLRANGITYPIHWYNFNPTPGDTKSNGWELIRKDHTTLATTYLPAYEAYRKLWTGVNPLPTVTVPSTATTTTIPANSDTFVASDAPTANYGSATTLKIDGSPVGITYLKFDLRPLAGHTLDVVKLKLKSGSAAEAGSSSQQFVRTCSTSWSEGSMTYNDRAATGTYTSGGGLQYTQPNTWYEMKLYVPDLQSRVGQTLCIAVVSPGSNNLQMQSRESANKPQLLVTSH